MARFMAQAQAAQWYVGEAAKRQDPYVAGWAASRLALFACRLVLAHNQIRPSAGRPSSSSTASGTGSTASPRSRISDAGFDGGT